MLVNRQLILLQMNIYKFIVLLLVVAMTSCGVEEYDETIPINVDVDDPELIIINDLLGRSVSLASNEGQQLGCITIHYPFEVKTADSIIYQVVNNIDFDLITQDSANQIIDFVYPLQIIDQLGLQQTVDNLWQLATIFAGCFPDSLVTNPTLISAYAINNQNSCFELVYPLNVLNDKGNIYFIKDEDELVVKMAVENVFFEFPFRLIKDQGQILTIYTYEDFEAALIACNGQIADSLFNCLECFDYLACYRLIYPIQIKIINQSASYTVFDASHMSKIYAQGKFLDLDYPLMVEAQDSQIIILNNEMELMDAVTNCYVKGDLFLLLYGTSLVSQPACYDVSFPIGASGPVGQKVQFNSLMEMEPILQDSSWFEFKLNYPIDVKILKNNNIKKLQNFIDLQELLAECEG